MRRRRRTLHWLLGCGIVFTSNLLAAAQLQEYVATIEVSPVKPDGKSWDTGGGAPDIRLQLADTDYTTADCRDRYRCEVRFVSRVSEWYLEVYDQDLSTDDLIGKGRCRLGDTCELDQAMVVIRRRD